MVAFFKTDFLTAGRLAGEGSDLLAEDCFNITGGWSNHGL